MCMYVYCDISIYIYIYHVHVYPLFDPRSALSSAWWELARLLFQNVIFWRIHGTFLLTW